MHQHPPSQTPSKILIDFILNLSTFLFFIFSIKWEFIVFNSLFFDVLVPPETKAMQAVRMMIDMQAISACVDYCYRKDAKDEDNGARNSFLLMNYGIRTQ